MGKMKISPVGGVKKGSTKPNKYVGVDTTSGYYGIKGKYDFDGGTSVTGSVTQDFSKADVSYPGGSQTFKSEGKPNVSITVEKKFGGPKKPDLRKFIEKKKTGGDINKKVEKELKKETPRTYKFMKGLSPVTHLRRYLKKKELTNKSSQDRKKKSNYNQGGVAKGCGAVMSNRRKKTKKR